eukprot:gene3517-biopygen1669
MIRKNGWLTHVELEEIKRRVTTEEEGVIDDSSVGEETVINEIPVTEPEIEPVVTFLERSERSEANTKMIEEIIEIMKEGNISQSRSLKKADRKSVNEAVKEVNDALISIRTENITDTNKLISAVALYVARKLGIGKPKIENKTKEPWWKRRISESINELRKHINILEREKRGEVSKKGKYHQLSKKYNITRKGISTVIEELKQRMQAKAFKLRRNTLVDDHRQNCAMSKGSKNGNAVDNYRPISCLPLMWKLLTGIISGNVYTFLDENEMLPEEQKGCKRNSRGAKDQLLVDKTILADCKRRHKNLAMAWVDYKKAYDMVPHSWIIECLRLYRVSDNVVNFIERSMTNWKVQLTSCGETLGLVNIRRGIFQGDSLSPLLFVICMIPLTEVLRKVKMGYTLDGVKINHLLFMDDLKLFAKNENEIDSLTSTVNLISQDIGMEFGIKKCGVVTLRRGKLTGSAGIELVNGEKIKEVGEEGYKYLGITELDRIKEEEMKKIFQREYFRRVRLIMQSKLNGRNKIKATNTWAISLMRYGAGIIKWRKDELESMDRRTRKLMTMSKKLHPRSDVARIYVSRKKGGRGLISCEYCIENETNNLAWYVKHARGNIMSKVRDLGAMNTEEAVAPNEHKNETKRRLEKRWKDKPMYGQFTKNTDGIDWEKSWSWLRNGDLKGCTEALVCSAQEQALRTNYTKHYIDKTSDTPLCRMCGDKGETVSHLVSECAKLAQTEYKRRHDNVARVVEARRPDIVVVDKEKKDVKIIDIAIPGDNRVKDPM